MSRWLSLSAFSALTFACAADDIVVATLPIGTNDGVGCETSDDCQPVEYCARQACGDTFGSCEPRPPSCDDRGMPTCGCDGVSYWNDCLRMQYGVSASRAGGCGSDAAQCMADNALECPVLGAACAKLVQEGEVCDEGIEGACWVLPVQCPFGGPVDTWSACGGPTPMECRDTCGAIRAGRPFQHNVTAQCMPDFPGR